MANFPNSQQARSRLYKSVSSTNYRLALLGLTLFTVFLFSIELGLHKKFLGEVEVSNDLGMTGIGIDAIGMGIVSKILFQPRIHPPLVPMLMFNLYLFLDARFFFMEPLSAAMAVLRPFENPPRLLHRIRLLCLL